jgi:spermidine synthase
VKPTERLGSATAPDGTVLTLYRHDGAYSIRVGGVELMSTRRHRSEERLAELACAPLAATAGARVLVGGLGLGFTLRAALRAVASDAEVVVAELVAGVIAWNRRPEYGLAADALADPRVALREADVADVIAERRGAFDAILLDVDNGAEAFTTAGNARLYGAAGVRAAAAALRPGGRLAYWSAAPDAAFEATLRRAGLAVGVELPRAHARGGPRHAIYVARAGVPSDGAPRGPRRP